MEVAANILNTQSRALEKGLSSSIGVGLTTPPRKKTICYETPGPRTSSNN
jgi:hypothetical protein